MNSFMWTGKQNRFKVWERGVEICSFCSKCPLVFISRGIYTCACSVVTWLSVSMYLYFMLVIGLFKPLCGALAESRLLWHMNPQLTKSLFFLKIAGGTSPSMINNSNFIGSIQCQHHFPHKNRVAERRLVELGWNKCCFCFACINTQLFNLKM